MGARGVKGSQGKLWESRGVYRNHVKLGYQDKLKGFEWCQNILRGLGGIIRSHVLSR